MYLSLRLVDLESSSVGEYAHSSSGLGEETPFVHGNVLEAHDFGDKQMCNRVSFLIYLSSQLAGLGSIPHFWVGVHKIPQIFHDTPADSVMYSISSWK